MTVDFYELHFFTESLIKATGAMIRRKLTEDLTIHTKKHAHDFVTNIDTEVEAFLVQEIKNRYPSHHIISEEGFGDTLNELTGTVWGIDPIDGTSNLVYKQADFAISIGIYHDGIGELAYIYDVMEDILYSAKRGEGVYQNQTRLPSRIDRQLEDSLIYTRFHYIDKNLYGIKELINQSRGLGSMSCASLGLVALGKGTIDGMLNKGGMKFWDIAAGKIFAEENGVVFQGVDGSPYTTGEEKDIFCAGPTLLAEVQNHLKLTL